jgi:hypothetical protein
MEGKQDKPNNRKAILTAIAITTAVQAPVVVLNTIRSVQSLNGPKALSVEDHHNHNVGKFEKAVNYEAVDRQEEGMLTAKLDKMLILGQDVTKIQAELTQLGYDDSYGSFLNFKLADSVRPFMGQDLAWSNVYTSGNEAGIQVSWTRTDGESPDRPYETDLDKIKLSGVDVAVLDVDKGVFNFYGVDLQSLAREGLDPEKDIQFGYVTTDEGIDLVLRKDFGGGVIKYDKVSASEFEQRWEGRGLTVLEGNGE